MALRKFKGAKNGNTRRDNEPNMANLTKIISNPNTGEAIEREYNIRYRSQIPIGGTNWIKSFKTSLTKVDKKDYLGYIHTLAHNFLEYETNRLKLKGTSRPAKKINFISVLGKSNRTVSRFLSYCSKRSALIKFAGWYYISPLICIKGKYISTDTVKIFMERDRHIRAALKMKDLEMIDTFKKLYNERER